MTPPANPAQASKPQRRYGFRKIAPPRVLHAHERDREQHGRAATSQKHLARRHWRSRMQLRHQVAEQRERRDVTQQQKGFRLRGGQIEIRLRSTAAAMSGPRARA